MAISYERLKKLTDAYFDSRMGIKTDRNGIPVTDENGEPITVCDKPMTVTGLTLALGLSSREELNNFRSKRSRALISRALMKIEENAEEKLFTKEYFNGAKLFLEVNFDRWKREQEDGFDAGGLLGESGCAQWSK